MLCKKKIRYWSFYICVHTFVHSHELCRLITEKQRFAFKDCIRAFELVIQSRKQEVEKQSGKNLMAGAMKTAAYLHPVIYLNDQLLMGLVHEEIKRTIILFFFQNCHIF